MFHRGTCRAGHQVAGTMLRAYQPGTFYCTDQLRFWPMERHIGPFFCCYYVPYLFDFCYWVPCPPSTCRRGLYIATPGLRCLTLFNRCRWDTFSWLC